jgi:hypothetical protein
MPLIVTIEASIPVVAGWLTEEEWDRSLSNDRDALIELLLEELQEHLEDPRNLITEVRWTDTIPHERL